MNFRFLHPLFVLFPLSVVFISCNSQHYEQGFLVSKSYLTKKWLEDTSSSKMPIENLKFANEHISSAQSKRFSKIIYKHWVNQLKHCYGHQWDNRMLTIGERKMPFYYDIYGDEPKDGRPLFISLHGGGKTSSEVNDQQHENQKILYKETMQKLEGIYLAPRGPTDSWNIWHEEHIDDFLELIIHMALIKENVNPNRVYLLGYSAGGDGVYQLAPRMAYRWAAAAMMAGHPNDASPLGLYNTPFTIHMGADDKAFERNKQANYWQFKLGRLAEENPGHYIHEVQIHDNIGHWMQRKDSVALPWMAKFTREALPQTIVWKQDNRLHSHFSWLSIPRALAREEGLIHCQIQKEENAIYIQHNYSDTLYIHLNDQMLDLDQNISVYHKGDLIFNGKLKKTISNIYYSIENTIDPHLIFPAKLTIVENQTVIP